MARSGGADPHTNGAPRLLSREAIRAAQDIESQIVEVPEWGGAVRVKALSGAQRDAYESSVVTMQGDRRVFNLRDLRARFVAVSVIDDEGNLLFGDEDIEWLTAKSARALDRVFRVAQRLSGMTDADLQELEANLGRAAPAS